MSKLLEIEDLRVSFARGGALVPAVKGVSFSMDRGEVLCIVGESGSGKSVTAKSILQLNPEDTTFYEQGRILFDGSDLLGMNRRDLNRYAGTKVSMIFQDPLTSLNPVYRVGQQMTSFLLLHNKEMTKRQAWDRSADLLQSVEIHDAERALRSYPFELSGGMRQRVMIAMALANSPELLIADEPTTALDVTTQAGILKLLMRVHEDNGTSMIFITHDLSIVYSIADRILVFHDGVIVESGSRDQIFYHPKQDYTKTLLNSVLRV